MASRAILRRRSVVSDYLNVYARSSQSFLGIAHSAQSFDSHAYHSGVNRPSVESNRLNEHKAFTGRAGFLFPSSFGSGFHGSRFSGFVGYGSSELVSYAGMRDMSMSVRNVTTVVAKKPEKEEDKKEDEVAKKKEASPEECDEAVISLSSLKAKAKAKRLQDSKKVAKSIVQRAWAIVLKIGPAIRAVASMSRKDWANKFVSTLKHY